MAGGRKDIEAGAAFVRIYVKGSEQVKRALASLGSGIATAGKMFAVQGAAIAAAMGVATATFASSGTQLERMSQRLGVGVKALAEYGFAAEHAGGSLETIDSAIGSMNSTLAAAMRLESGASDALARLGLSIGDLQGLSKDAQFEKIIGQIARVKDPGERAARAMAIFGGAGAQLLPMMKNGAAGVRAMREEAERLGLVMSPERTKQAEELTQAWNSTKLAAKGLAQEIGAALAPAATRWAKIATDAIASVTKWIQANGGLFASIKRLATAFRPIEGIAKWIEESFGDSFDFIKDAWGGIVDAFAAGDLEAAADVAVAGLIVGFTKIKDYFGELWLDIKFAFLDTWNEVTFAAADVWFSFVERLKTAWADFVGYVKTLWADVTNAAGQKILSFVIDREISDVKDKALEEYKRLQGEVEAGRMSPDEANKKWKETEGAAIARQKQLEEERRLASGNLSGNADKAKQDAAVARDKAKADALKEQGDRAKAIDDARNAARQDLLDATARDSGKPSDDLLKAKDALARAVAAAKEKRARVRPDRTPPGAPEGPSLEFLNLRSSLGTFSATGAGLLGGRTDPKLAEMQKQTKKLARLEAQNDEVLALERKMALLNTA